MPAALASFYALGAKRNGWLYHRSLAGRADADRAALTAAGLDVARLEGEGRIVFSEMDPHIGVDEYVHSWDPEMEAALTRGFDAVWCARFPVGPDTAFIDRSLDTTARGRPTRTTAATCPCASTSWATSTAIAAPRN